MKHTQTYHHSTPAEYHIKNDLTEMERNGAMFQAFMDELDVFVLCVIAFHVIWIISYNKAFYWRFGFMFGTYLISKMK